jgi:tRNA-Thr(GGU) m(6)t(6)A37 methyltransferase TsaA
MPAQYTISQVATVRSSRGKPTDDHWSKESATIVLNESYSLDALTGIEAFSHLEILFLFDRVGEQDICTGARPPRGNVKYAPVGIFAQRAKARPNRIGVTVVRLLSREGRTLTVAGLDAIDGTPVLDIKPVFREFLPKGEIRQPDWATELLKEYW